VPIHQARIGAISDGWPASPTKSRTGVSLTAWPPFVKIHKWSGTKSNQTEAFLGELAVKLREAAEREIRWQNSKVVRADSVRSIDAFHRDLRYEGDLHRADMAWAVHAARRGLSAEEIRTQLLYARDLSKKGHRARQVEYAYRTTTKALVLAQRICSASESSGTLLP
jgi:hypothetical protein